MAHEYLKNHRGRIVNGISLGVAVVVGVLICVRLIAYGTGPIRKLALADRSANEAASDPCSLQRHISQMKELTEKLKPSSLFAPPAPEPAAPQVSSILGRRVLIGGKWYKIGETAAGAKILAIEPSSVKVEWKGEELVLQVVAVASGAPPPPPPPKPAETTAPTAPKQGAPTPVAQQPAEEDPLAWMGIELPAAVRAKFLEHWNSMTDEQKQKAKEEWSKLSDEQKQQAADAMANQA